MVILYAQPVAPPLLRCMDACEVWADGNLPFSLYQEAKRLQLSVLLPCVAAFCWSGAEQ